MKLHHVAVTCRSQETADRFYEGILGLEKIKTMTLSEELTKQLFDTAQECQVMFYGNEDFAIEVFVPASAPVKNTAFVHLCLEVKNRERFVEKCQGKGLGVNWVPRGDSMIALLEDFDGNLFEIKELRG
jgi:catechol 2,3-dioxygenase-like lactoylglutathione lyase family enzyme